MRQRILDHLRRMQQPRQVEEAWSQQAFPEPQQPAMPPPPQQGKGGQLNAGALESFLPPGNEELNPEAALDETGVMQGGAQGRFADRLRKKRMAVSGQNAEMKRGGLEWQ